MPEDDYDLIKNAVDFNEEPFKKCKWLGLEYKINSTSLLTIENKRWTWPFTWLIRLAIRIKYNLERRSK